MSDPWHSPQRRRHFFENYAKVNSFDPLSAEAWYSQNVDLIMKSKVLFCYYFIYYYVLLIVAYKRGQEWCCIITTKV